MRVRGEVYLSIMFLVLAGAAARIHATEYRSIHNRDMDSHAIAYRTMDSQGIDYQNQAKTLVNTMASRQFSEVEKSFNETMTGALPADRLASAWDSVVAQAGAFQTIVGTRQQELQGYQAVFVTCHFGQQDLDAKVVYDAKGRVAGLFFVPPQTKAPEGSIAKTAKPSDLVGDWMGTLNTGPAKLKLVFHITSTASGLKATLDSPDQGAKDIPFSSAQLKDGRVKLDAASIKGAFEGALSTDLSTLTGTWSQGGGSLPLQLKRVKSAAELQHHPRPQEPKKPYPYREEDVAYDNQAGGDRLAATLTVPNGKGPFPAVVLITGSGPQDRDESLLGHKPFLVLADYLTRKGIAVLRADDRGVAKSTGNFSAATTADFATDTEAGVAYLKTRPEINPRQIGLIGHSEGGIIAPMVAARNHDVAFIVMMAGSAVPGDEILVTQATLLAEAGGKSHEAALKVGAEERDVLNVLKQAQDDASLKNALHDKLAAEMPEEKIKVAIAQLMSPWFRYFLAYDPAPALGKVACPVLALNGERDLQVPPKQNLPVIRKALEAGGNKSFEVDELPALNHLFQTATTGSPEEYSTIEETIAPVALEKISEWILKEQQSALQQPAISNIKPYR
ncbi:MAG TPA: alpha/beta fold hydrolase [Candidatus Angelobacter sp.]|nr:alpha/beta fold hydrolase [Candidatus Angelobacter sp.]